MLQDLRYAIRLLARRPAVTALVVATLTVGIAAATIGFSLADAILWHPLPFPDADRLVRIQVSLAPGASSSVSTDDVLGEWPAAAQVFEEVHAFALDSAIVTVGGEPDAVTVAALSPGLLAALAVTPSQGRVFRQDEFRAGSPAVIVSADLWRRARAASGAVAEATLLVEGERRTIVGVMPEGFAFPVARVALWRPYVPNPAATRVTALGKLNPGLTVEAGRILARQTADAAGPVRDVRIAPFVAASPTTATALNAFLGAVGLLLLIAVANAGNLLLAEAVRRDAEMAIRRSLGAPRSRLIRQLLTETLLLSAAAATLAALISAWALRVLVVVVPYLMSFQTLRPIGLDWRALACASAAAMLAGLGASSFAMLRAMRIQAGAALRRQASGHPRHGHLRSALTVAQISVTLALLASTAVLTRAIGDINRVQPGFDPDHLVRVVAQLSTRMIEDDAATRLALERARQEALGIPGVLDATVSYASPPSLSSRSLQELDVDDLDLRAAAETVWFGRVDDRFFSTLRVPILEGRGVDASDQAGSAPVAVVSRALGRRLWPDADPLGQRLREPDGPWLTVVGIAGDVSNGGGGAGQGALAFYTPRTQSPPWWFEGLTVRTERPFGEIVPELRSVLRRTLPGAPVIETTRGIDLVRNVDSRLRFANGVMTTLAAVALTVAMIGVYGTFHFLVRHRARDMAIRLAIGAVPARVMWMVFASSVRLLVLGLVLGLPLALAATRAWQGLLTSVSAYDPAALISSALILVAAALAATWWPARRASRVRLVDVLRES
jgi:putative ABC transport system permease protein